METDSDVLNSIYGDEDPIPVIFQSGYLTIKAMTEFGLYRLGFPNREVEEGFAKFLIPFYTRFSKIEFCLRYRSLFKKYVGDSLKLSLKDFKVSLLTLLMNW